MKQLYVIILALVLIGCDSNRIEQDKEWAEEYYSNFKKGMTIGTVYDVLNSKKNNIQFYNNCLKTFEYPMGYCAKGYSLVTGIELPRKDTILGQGTMQIYFTFDDKQQLIDYMYEIYYPAHHR